MEEENFLKILQNVKKTLSLHPLTNMVVVAQLVRASDCGSEGRRFEPDHPPQAKKRSIQGYMAAFVF